MLACVPLVLIAAGQGEVGEKPLRLVPFVTLTSEGQLQLRVENPCERALNTTLTAELILAKPERAPGSDATTPSIHYRARLDLRGDAARPAEGATVLQVPAGASRTWVAEVSSLHWYDKVGATRSSARPFRQAVPPGRYRLALWFESGESVWWQSQGMQIAVDSTGRVASAETEFE